MKIPLVYSLISFLLIISCAGVKEKGLNDKLHIEEAISLVGFFNQNAFDRKSGAYYSEIDNQGNVLSGKVFNVALSRLIYGLSYSSSIDSSNLIKAQKAATFQIDNLVAKDSYATYFVSFFDIESNKPDTSLSLDIWQQAYGLCGLTELYRNSPNEELLSKIHLYHKDFIKRFHDEIHGGFYGNYEKNRKVTGSKTLQSLIYPITAYMENLWLTDFENKDKYEPYLKENIRIAYENGWNKELGWVNIKFDDQWSPCTHTSADSVCFSVTPGHNFQLASVFLRSKDWDFLTEDEKEKYENLGMSILKATLQKPIFPTSGFSQGFYSEVNPVDNTIIDNRKTWWQHCEALLTLSLAKGEFDLELKNLEEFFFSTFPDKENGGEFFFVDDNNHPLTDELKGSIGKSAYHTIEMIRFLNK